MKTAISTSISPYLENDTTYEPLLRNANNKLYATYQTVKLSTTSSHFRESFQRLEMPRLTLRKYNIRIYHHEVNNRKSCGKVLFLLSYSAEITTRGSFAVM